MSLAEDLMREDWDESQLLVPFGKLKKNPFYADRRFERLKEKPAKDFAIGRYSALACLVAYRYLQFGHPYVLHVQDKPRDARYFLLWQKMFFDLEGWHSRKPLEAAYPTCALVKTKWEEVLASIQKQTLEEREYLVLKERFISLIDRNVDEWELPISQMRKPNTPVLPVGAIGGEVFGAIAEKWKTLKLKRADVSHLTFNIPDIAFLQRQLDASAIRPL